MRSIFSNSPAGNQTPKLRCALGDGHFSKGSSRRRHVGFGDFRYLITASWCGWCGPADIRFVFQSGGRIRSLMIAFVEVQERIDLSLPGEQLPQPFLVLETTIRGEEVRNRTYRISTPFTAAGSPSRKIRLWLLLLATGATRGVVSVATEAGQAPTSPRPRVHLRPGSSSKAILSPAVARTKRTDSTYGRKVCWRRL